MVNHQMISSLHRFYLNRIRNDLQIRRFIKILSFIMFYTCWTSDNVVEGNYRVRHGRGYLYGSTFRYVIGIAMRPHCLANNRWKVTATTMWTPWLVSGCPVLRRSTWGYMTSVSSCNLKPSWSTMTISTAWTASIIEQSCTETCVAQLVHCRRP